jgi:DNA-binding LacI/PurR family transcriptional regulator
MAGAGMRGTASIRDIASAVGCSISTVSRVINDRDGVDPSTRRKVQDAIQRLEYTPNLTARGLRVKRGHLIGVAIPDSTVGAFSVVVQYALEAAAANGFNVVLVNSHEDPDLEETLIKSLLRREINGVLLTRVSDESRVVAAIARRNLPIVVIDRAFEHENVSNVVLNNHRAGCLAAEHLLGLGHREVACITGPLKIGLSRDRLKGFQATLAGAGVGLAPSHLYEGNFLYDTGIRGVRALAERGARYTGLWAMNDLMGFGSIRALTEAGLDVPRDVSVLGMDDLEIAEMVTPPLTTIHYPIKELVERAMELLISQITTREFRTETIMLEPSLTIRRSTAARTGLDAVRSPSGASAGRS